MSIRRIAATKDGKRFYVKDESKDLHTQYGYVKAADIKAAKDGDKVQTNTGKDLYLFSPSFMDRFSKIKRGAQIIPLKDVGSIITEAGINQKSKIVDAGAGSGALACLLGHIAKEVTTYEIREDFAKIVQHNIDFLDMKNVTLKLQDITQGINEKNVDVITLDLPKPWEAAEHAAKALKPGGFLVSYSPTIPQVSDLVESVKANEHFSYLKTIEITEREWEVDGRKVRPKSQTIGHSGFLTFARRIA